MSRAIHAATVVIAAVMTLTVCVTKRYQAVIEVARGSTLEARVEVAKAIASETRLSRLRDELHRALPTAEPDDLATLSLSWNETRVRSLGDGQTIRHVYVAISMRERPGSDAKAIVDRAVKILQKELTSESLLQRSSGLTVLGELTKLRG